MPSILPQLALVLLASIAVCLLRGWWQIHLPESSLSIPSFTLLGVSLAIFLGFRNTVSYDRFWEARKLWGSLLISTRSLARQMISLEPDDPQTRQFVEACAGFAHALKAQLRDEEEDAALARLLPGDLLAEVRAARFKPAMILLWLGKQARKLAGNDAGAMRWHAIDHNLGVLSEVLGGCERIAGTPMPFTYRVLLNRTVTLYCLLLPAGLVSSIGWLTPPIAVFIAYTYLALEKIAEELEEPFGTEGNDLPLATMCHTIEASLREMLGLPPEQTAPPMRGVYMN